MAENPTQPQAETTPDAVIKGRFALYETPDGGYHLTYQPDGEPDAKHVQIPGFYVKMALKQAGGKGGLRKLMNAFGA